jgi:hypothetical protein
MTAFLASVMTIVLHTPVWVWPLFALLLFLGWQRTRDSTMALWRMLILPTVVTLFALFGFIVVGLGALPAILVGLVIGGAVGWHFERRSDTRRLPDGKVWLRGEWLTFTLLVLIMVFRYVINVVPVLDPVLNADASWHFGTLSISAALSSLFLGRTAARLQAFFAVVSSPASIAE